MDTVLLLSRFADPETIHSLSLNQRLFAGLITTILGMGITFVALILLQLVIGLLEKVAGQQRHLAADHTEPVAEVNSPADRSESRQAEKLVAAITTALAVQLETAASNIVIRSIRKIEDHSPIWNKVGIAEQMNDTP